MVAESWPSWPGLGLLLEPCGPWLSLESAGQDLMSAGHHQPHHQQDVISHSPALPWLEAPQPPLPCPATRPGMGRTTSLSRCQNEKVGVSGFLLSLIHFSQRHVQLFSGSTDCQFPKPTTDWFPVRHGGNCQEPLPKHHFHDAKLVHELSQQFPFVQN